MKHMEWERQAVPSMLDRVMTDLQVRISEGESGPKNAQAEDMGQEQAPALPYRVNRKREIDGAELLQIEVLGGRLSWQHGIERLLTHTWKILREHRWGLLEAPLGIEWFTSDQPVIKLNYFAPNNYNLLGGWNSKGTELMLPLSTRHMLYTRIGDPRAVRNAVLTFEQGKQICRMIAENAHRYIFCRGRRHEVPGWRPRVSNAAQVEAERQGWKNFHDEHSAAERAFLTHPPDQIVEGRASSLAR